MSQCRSCGAAIIWGVTESGKRMPLDAEPCDDGTIMFFGDAPDSIIIVVGAAADAQIEPRYKSHFATCHDSAHHRNK